MIIRVPYLPFRIAGFVVCKGLIVFHKDATDATLAHEKVHEDEWNLLWPFKWLISPVFRMRAEVRGYAAQARIEGKTLESYIPWVKAYFLSKKAKLLLPYYIKQLAELEGNRTNATPES